MNTLYAYAWYFLIYSFLGWCLEVAWHALRIGKIINRGFLNGPVCPVYGCGMITVCALLRFVPQNTATHEYNVLVLFSGGALLATLVELIAGWILYHLFHARWWDYSKMPFNIGGYICPLFSVFWGIACVIVVKYVHPLVSHASFVLQAGIPGWIVLAVLYAALLADLIVTVLTAAGLNRDLKELDQIRTMMRKPSDAMSDMIGTVAMDSARKVDEGRVQAALGREELKDHAEEAQLAIGEKLINSEEKVEKQKEETEKSIALYRQELQKRYEELTEDLTTHPHFGKTRLLNAFPDMVHREYDDLLKEIQKKLHPSDF